MAMIVCPQCGKEISDKAEKCVQCGYEFEKIIPKKICTECGTELGDEETICHNCGAPVETAGNKENAPQQVELTGVKIAKKSKKFIIIGIVAVVAIAAGIFGVLHMQKVNAEKEAAAQQAAAEKKAEEEIEEYKSNLELATMTMLEGEADAEICGNLIKKVWYNAIYEERDTETDKYTRSNGRFVSDFNTALSNLYSDSDFAAQISGIEDNQDTVKSVMKELMDPPEGYEDAYDAISEYYSAYTEFTNLVISPSGSYQTFSENFNNAASESFNCYEAMDLYLS